MMHSNVSGPFVGTQNAVRPDSELRFPGILVGTPERHVVWGLTYRFLEVFFEIAGKPLPNRWDDFEGRS